MGGTQSEAQALSPEIMWAAHSAKPNTLNYLQKEEWLTILQILFITHE